MKLLKCHVTAFGKLQNIDIDFTDGLNVFNYENGWGKTSLSVFLKAMFYGLKGGRLKNLNENEREKYKSWNYPGKTGGFVDFSHSGKSFRIERFFGSKESEDTVKLIDLNTGKEYSNNHDLGKRLFEIDEDGFLSTLFFSQSDLETKGVAGISAKYNSAVYSVDDDSFTEALKSIDEKVKKLVKTGGKGIIAEEKNKIAECNKMIERAENASEALKIVQNNYNAKKEEANALKKEIGKLNEQIIESGKVEANKLVLKRKNDLLNEINQSKTAIKNKESLLSGNDVSLEEIDAYIGVYKDYAEIKAKREVSSDSVSVMEKEIKVTKTKNPSVKIFVIILLLSIIVALSGIAFSFLSLVAGVIAGVLGTICAVADVIYYFFCRKKYKEADYRNSQRINAQRKIADDYRLIENKYKEKLDLFRSSFPLISGDYYDFLDMLKECVKDIQNENLLITNAENKIRELGNVKETFDEVETVDPETLRRTYKEKNEKLDAVNDALSKDKANIAYYENTAASLYDLENRKTELSESVKEHEKYYKLLLKTSEFLKSADEDVKARYRAPLENSLNKYISLICGTESSARIDTDLNITIEENGESKNVAYYSEGYKDLFNIAKRFALIDVLYEKDKPFVILDDPFCDFDEEKIANGIALIKKLSEEYQILYFVCHKSRT